MSQPQHRGIELTCETIKDPSGEPTEHWCACVDGDSICAVSEDKIRTLIDGVLEDEAEIRAEMAS
ncbi:hypothetical protein Pla123a_40420 [Posidoniimonas polymericola]|uniref:Uncharacterized protein n=1 Tax=Posidoniimonas polymericola TaxID=2528002 RepID=A0A5C5YD84_9BACT|nr:hypothetical protein [Posidoniimonas polymericola]TWT72743.1 hypothetical protein Pla123a_40420 [Posidoniimonas polymericola]